MSKVTYQVKEFSILVRGRCKPLGSLNSFLSSAPQRSGANPVSWLTLLLAITMEEMGVGGVAAPAGSQFGEFSFAFEGQKSLMAMPFLVY